VHCNPLFIILNNNSKLQDWGLTNANAITTAILEISRLEMVGKHLE
jgi:hypothetical protein